MTAAQSTPPAVEVRNVSKRFPGVQALADVSMTLGRGEVLAVIGENGAGKSTLMKILAGIQQPDSGQLVRSGEPVSIHGVRRATQLGIALIHQELNLADNLSVAANISLGREPGRFGFFDSTTINRRATAALARIGLNVSPGALVSQLPVGQQQMVEIAKALAADAQVLIMDEPTSSLSTTESERLFTAIEQLSAAGVSIVYISHRLGEVKRLAHRAVVLRDGRNAGELAREEIDHDRMVRLMVGRDISQFYARRKNDVGAVALEVEHLRVAGQARHAISFQVRGGEIVGLAGLVGAGRTELLEALFGMRPTLGGTIRVRGKAVVMSSPRAAIAAGVALVPEDRKQHGLVLEETVRRNLSLVSLARQQRFGFVDRQGETRLATAMVDRLRIKTPGLEQIVQYLSGGNQQKVVLGKWLSVDPAVLLLDEPTRGIDVGAKQDVYQMMEALAERGVAILFASSEMEEVLGMSDRTLVMHEGRLAGQLARSELSEEAVMQLATGRLGPDSADSAGEPAL